MVVVRTVKDLSKGVPSALVLAVVSDSSPAKLRLVVLVL